MLARTSRTTLLVGLGLALAVALGSGCNRQRTAVPASPATSQGVATAPGHTEVAATPKPRASQTPAKGIGASGGPAGREDLRPERFP